MHGHGEFEFVQFVVYRHIYHGPYGSQLLRWQSGLVEQTKGIFPVQKIWIFLVGVFWKYRFVSRLFGRSHGVRIGRMYDELRVARRWKWLRSARDWMSWRRRPGLCSTTIERSGWRWWGRNAFKKCWTYIGRSACRKIRSGGSNTVLFELNQSDCDSKLARIECICGRLIGNDPNFFEFG
jgi:hypothetical protein